MSLYYVIITAIALSIDAFSVSASSSAATKSKPIYDFLIPLSFGFFQALMPFIGYHSTLLFSVYIKRFDHWIAFGLLGFIGLKMIIDAYKMNKGHEVISEMNVSKLLVLSVATSIDALAAGIGFAVLNIDILPVILMIGSITLILSYVGVKFGKFIGNKNQKIATFIGGTVLIAIGVKILIEHLSQIG